VKAHNTGNWVKKRGYETGLKNVEGKKKKTQEQ
jgi:hypothetical protein